MANGSVFHAPDFFSLSRSFFETFSQKLIWDKKSVQWPLLNPEFFDLQFGKK